MGWLKFLHGKIVTNVRVGVVAKPGLSEENQPSVTSLRAALHDRMNKVLGMALKSRNGGQETQRTGSNYLLKMYLKEFLLFIRI